MSWPPSGVELPPRASAASAIDRPLWNNAIVAPDTHSLKREYRELDPQQLFFYIYFIIRSRQRRRNSYSNLLFARTIN